MRKTMRTTERYISLIAACTRLVVLLALALSAGPAWAVSGAAFTTFDATLGGCLDSPNGINCNHYTAKNKVYMSGGPNAAGLSDGTYFFAVLVPGFQNGGFIEGADGNLSDTTAGATPGDNGAGDPVANRTFSVANHQITSYSGTHAIGTSPNGRSIIGLAPFDDTSNVGGVYILAICQEGANKPSQCKYDAFKLDGGVPPLPLTVTKDANPSFDRTFHWSIQKSVDKTLVKQVGGSATFNYTISVTHDTGTDSNWQVDGTITITNPNPAGGGNNASAVTVTDEVLSSYLTDPLTKIQDVGSTCTVDTSNGTDPAENSSVQVPYLCTYYQPPAASSETNDVSISWVLPASTTNTAEFTQGFTFENPNLIDECANVSDSFAGPLGTGPLCNTDPSPSTYPYSRTIPVPPFNCLSYDNTATFTTTDNGVTGSASKTVTVCGPVRTGALTMGFWQNKNGQGIITSGASTSGVCNSGTWLRQYLPFQGLSATATCSSVATYVSTIIKAANASGAAMNAMLKGQMLATALDVYFSAPALGGNKIGAAGPIGGVSIDLTLICTNIATCSTFVNVSSAFGGSPSLTISQMLSYAASQSNSGGMMWYGNVKSTQELAKDAFDAINNQVAFAP